MRDLKGRTLVVASHNAGKLREFADLLGPFGIDAKSAKEFGLPEPDETGTTFEENAYIKAFAAASATGLPAMSDDSGLVVDALDGQPGVYTANWAEKADGARDFMMAMEKTEKLLQERGATDPRSADGPLRRRHLPRMAGRRGRIFPWRGGGPSGLAAARHERLRLRSGLSPGRPHPHLRRDGRRGEARLETGSAGRPVASCPCLPEIRPRTSGLRLNRLLPIDRDPGFGVYVHWPFCAAKCPYCDFNSHVRHQGVDQERYAKAFLAELADRRRRTGPRTVTSIFIGGGTPSLMKPETVGAILEGIAANWSVPSGIEVTLEANPSSVEADRFRGYRAAGVNRVSLGVQALNDKDLRFLGRLHNVEEALKAIGLAREIFPRLSFDLIYARPGQTPEAWAEELKRAIGHAVDHLSLYQLTIEEGTRFHDLHAAGKFAIPDADAAPTSTRSRRR
jgi:hypothetical protein